jgi:peptidoglycan glycosyltransferase
MIPISLAHFAFWVGLFTLALLAWHPRFSLGRFLPLLALLVWMVGVVAVRLAFEARGSTWLAGPVRSFSFDLKAKKDAPLGDHHVLLSPSPVDRLPRRFDSLKTATALTVGFQLQPQGEVSDIHIKESSGDPELDTSVVKAVGGWRFGVLPANFPDQRDEPVKVRISNRYPLLDWRLLGLPTLFMVVWMIGTSLLPSAATPSRGSEINPDDTGSSVNLRRLLTCAGFLAGLGWLLVWRLAPDVGLLHLVADHTQDLWRGLFVTALMAFIVATWQPLGNFIAHWRWLWLSVGFLLLLLTVPFGTDLGRGVTLWLDLPGLPIFQPIEVVKLLVILFMAGSAYDAAYPGKMTISATNATKVEIQSWARRFAPIVAGFLLVFGALFWMGDFGPIALLTTLLLLLLLLQGLEVFPKQAPRQVVIVFVCFVMAGMFAFSKGKLSRLETRVSVLRSPWQALKSDRPHIKEAREHMAQVFWGVSSGGATGLKWGRGRPEAIRDVQSDFPFAALAEELGWFGGFAILALLAALVVDSLHIAASREDAVEKMLAAGLGLMLAIQIVLTVGGNLALLPLTGMTLPLLSDGGTSLLIVFCSVGILTGLVWRRAQPRHFPPDQEARIQALLPRLSSHWVPVAFALLIIKLAWLQSPFGWAAVATRPHRSFHNTQEQEPRTAYNPRVDRQNRLLASHIARGRILDRNGEELAVTTPQGRRYFHHNEYVHLIGKEMTTRSGQPAGRIGLESFMNGPLSGRLVDGGLLSKLPTLKPEQRGFDVQLTLDQNLQSRAYQLLEASGYDGCIVGVDPQTGEILVAANRPVLNTEEMTTQEWEDAFNNHPEMPSFCYRRIYAPGSTFKTLIAAAALENSVLSPRDTIECDGDYRPPGGGRSIHDHGWRRRRSGHGRVTLGEALEVSCNPAFAETGVHIGWDHLMNFARKAGFSRDQSLVPAAWRGERMLWMQSSKSTLTPGGKALKDVEPDEVTPVALAQTSIGQRNVRMTPLHLASWTAAIANDGWLASPSIVHSVQTADGRTIWRYHPQFERVMSKRTARLVAGMMEQVVEKGTGRPARVEGFHIAGKTGTPEEDGGGTNALFIAFAPVERPRLAIAVVIEGKKGGGAVAGPLAAELLRAAAARE